MKSFVLLILCCFFQMHSAQELHDWQPYINFGIAFNQDHSEILIVSPDRVSLWNAEDASLIRTMDMPDYKSKPISIEDFEFIDAAPDLSEFVYKVGSTFRRYMLDIEDNDLFPDFQKHRVKQIIGYDSQGWIVFFSEGFYQGFYRVQQKGNVSLLEFISMEYISQAEISNDHKYIIFSRDGTFRYANILSKEVTDTELPAVYWKQDHLPSGMITLYSWDGSKKEGKKVRWRRFIELGNEPGKKIRGKKDENHFPSDNYCKEDGSFVFGTTEKGHWTIYYSDVDKDRAKAHYQYMLQYTDHNNCEDTKSFVFGKPKEYYELEKAMEQDLKMANYKAEKQKQKQLKPTYFKNYISKFVNLPNRYKLDYNRIQGVDVTSYDFVQTEKYRNGNPQEMAIGRICNCSNGNTVVLRVTRRKKNGMDRQSFRIFTYDPYGKEIDHQKIGETQKYNGSFPLLTYFTIESSNDSWTAYVKETYNNQSKEKDYTYQGSCNP